MSQQTDAVCPHSGHRPAIKRKEILTQAAGWRSLGGVVPSERSQNEGAVASWDRQVRPDGSRMAATGVGWGGGGWGAGLPSATMETWECQRRSHRAAVIFLPPGCTRHVKSVVKPHNLRPASAPRVGLGPVTRCLCACGAPCWPRALGQVPAPAAGRGHRLRRQPAPVLGRAAGAGLPGRCRRGLVAACG